MADAPKGFEYEAKLPKESIEVDWSSALDNDEYKTCEVTKLEKDKDAFTVPLLLENECKELIENCEKIGFKETNFTKEYRSNTRLIIVDKPTSKLLFERIKPYLPEYFDVCFYSPFFSTVPLFLSFPPPLKSSTLKMN